MAQIKIYNQETNTTLNIDLNIASGVLDDTTTGEVDYYLLVSTTIPTLAGGTFPTFRVRTMADTPPGYPAAFDFNQLALMYYEYFTTTAQLAESSSSSSSSFGESSSSSSSLGESSSSSSLGESSSSSSSLDD